MQEYCWSLYKNENEWNCGFASVDDCIADAKKICGEEIIYVGIKKPYEPEIPAESIIEIINDDVYNYFDDIADTWMCYLHDTPDAQLQELEIGLNLYLKKWLIKYNLQPYFYDVIDIQKIILSDV